jgi:tryptophan synthase alpha chain
MKSCFARLKEQGRTALVPFVTAGDPRPEVTVPLLHELVAAGADIIELGVPFSDPMAEGPAIQMACERALRHHVTLKSVLQMVSDFRRQDDHTPVVMMGYLNPIEVMGYDAFAAAAAEAGVDGVITVDLPPEEADEYIRALEASQVDRIFLLSPTSSAARIQQVCSASSGFVYYVSLRGVTGAANLDIQEVAQRLRGIRQYCQLPVGVGFGIHDPDSAAQVAGLADAVIVGSAIVKRVAALAETPEKIPAEVGAFVRELRQGIDKTDSEQVVTTA